MCLHNLVCTIGVCGVCVCYGTLRRWQCLRLRLDHLTTLQRRTGTLQGAVAKVCCSLCARFQRWLQKVNLAKPMALSPGRKLKAMRVVRCKRTARHCSLVVKRCVPRTARGTWGHRKCEGHGGGALHLHA